MARKQLVGRRNRHILHHILGRDLGEFKAIRARRGNDLICRGYKALSYSAKNIMKYPGCGSESAPTPQEGLCDENDIRPRGLWRGEPAGREPQ